MVGGRHPKGSFRLSHGLARRRLLYPSPMIAAPSVLLIDIPAASRGGALSLGRYYPVLIESSAEHGEMERFISAPRLKACLPDLLDRRPSNLRSDNILVSRYDPPAADWPWLSVAHWPPSFAEAAREQGIDMARGCYTMEAFTTSDALDDHCSALLANLGAHCSIEVRLLTADRLAAPGHA